MRSGVSVAVRAGDAQPDITLVGPLPPSVQTDHRSNPVVEAMNRLYQQAQCAALFSASRNIIAVAYRRMSKLKHLCTSLFVTATPSRQRGVPRETA